MGLWISLNGTLNRKSHLSERGNGLNVQLRDKLNWRSVPQRNWSNRLFSGFTGELILWNLLRQSTVLWDYRAPCGLNKWFLNIFYVCHISPQTTFKMISDIVPISGRRSAVDLIDNQSVKSVPSSHAQWTTLGMPVLTHLSNVSPPKLLMLNPFLSFLLLLCCWFSSHCHNLTFADLLKIMTKTINEFTETLFTKN